jgi:hypothetical protein
MTTEAGTGNSSTTHVTSDTEYTFSELSPANGYSFSVTASNSEGTSSSEKDSFRQAPIFVRGFPQALTTGLDGSIWVASLASMTVQQIVNDNGVWKAQAAIDVGRQPQALTTGLDGSIWVANYRSNTVQQIVEDNGVWTAQAAIDINSPMALTTGLDGSIWVANYHSNTVQQIVNANGVWTAQAAIDIDFDGSYLTTGLDGSIWVAGTHTTLFVKNGYVQQITKDNGVWTAQGKIEVGGSGMYTGWIHGLTTGLDGSIWVAFQASNYLGNLDSQGLQQVVNDNGAWTAQGPIELAANVEASAITTGLDGSIWGAGFASDANYVQQFVKDNGVWTEQPGIVVGLNGYSLTTGLDGSIWVTNSSSVQQIVVQPNAPSDLAAVFGAGPGEMTLAWQPPVIDGGTPVISYTATVSQGTYTKTITTSDTSCVFDGLTLGSGPTYFTVTATNFAGVGKPAGLQIDASGNTIPKLHRGIGITTDGVAVTDGGFDGSGNTYSWTALGDTSSGGALVGSSLISGGLAFDIGSPNQPDFTKAAGQDIEPTGSGSVLTLVGARLSDFDAIGYQTFTLNFDDDTTAIWTQSFSDWCQWQYQDNESILSTQSYRNTASGGTDDTTNYIYSYGYTLPEGKTLESITLPNNSLYNIFSAVLSEPTAVDLDWNAYGLDASQGQVPNGQGFDGNGNYYNANYYNSGGYGGILGLQTASNSDQDTGNFDYRTITWGGATFNLGPAPNHYSQSNNRTGNDNFVHAQGDAIDLVSGDFSTLLMIGAGANGNQTDQVFTLKFTDGSTATWTQSFTDWRNNAPTNNPPPSGTELASTGETVVAATNVINKVGNQAGSGSDPARAYVYGYSLRHSCRQDAGEHHAAEQQRRRHPGNGVDSCSFSSVVRATKPDCDTRVY